MDIKEIALKVASELDFSGPIAISPLPDHLYIDFAEALIAELAKQNEPIAWWNGKETAFFEHETDGPVGEVKIPLYTFPPTAEQIANETAEACAKYVNRFLNGDGIQDEAWIRDIESGIRRGTWKEFKQS